MTQNLQKIPIHHPNIVWQEVDDGVVIVTPTAGKVRALNQIGADIWRMIDGHLSLSDILQHLNNNHPSIPAQQLERDLDTFVTDLSNRQLILWQ